MSGFGNGRCVFRGCERSLADDPLGVDRAKPRLTSRQPNHKVEDLLGETLPVNVPGTDREYPNWQRRVSVDVEDLAERADIAARLEEIRAARG